jgi:hypothetical protein
MSLRNWICASLAGALVLWGNVAANAIVIPLSSIAEIPFGQTIDFEQPGRTANDILSAFNMIAVPDPIIGTLTFPVTGNSAAPISDRALSGQGFAIESTRQPWFEIGLTGIGTVLGETSTLELAAFGRDGTELGTLTRVFAPANSSFTAYNAAAVFLGFASTIPIRSILLTSDNPNVACDNLRFFSVPEASSLLLLGPGLSVLIAAATTARRGNARFHPLLGKRMLESRRQSAEYVEQELPLRGGGVHPLGQRSKGDAALFEAVHHTEQMRQRAAQAIEFPDHKAVAWPNKRQCLCESGTVVAAAAGVICE